MYKCSNNDVDLSYNMGSIGNKPGVMDEKIYFL